MRYLITFLLIVSIAGIVGSELLLVWAMVKKDAGISTRTAGKYIMIFLIMLILVVMTATALGQNGLLSMSG